MAHVIIFGNEKGGSGKTTTAMHLIISLLYLNFKAATLDIDLRQGSLTRYIENRRRTIDNKKRELKLPTHFKLNKEYNINQAVEYTNDEFKILKI